MVIYFENGSIEKERQRYGAKQQQKPRLAIEKRDEEGLAVCGHANVQGSALGVGGIASARVGALSTCTKGLDDASTAVENT